MDEFLDFQMLSETFILQHILTEATIRDKDADLHFYQMDIIWGYLCSIKDPVTSLPRFPMLGKMAKLVLTLPHSNASTEGVFSLIHYNKRDSRNLLENRGSLLSLMTIKLANPESSQNCYKFEPPKEVVLKSTSVNWEYNKAHSSSL